MEKIIIYIKYLPRPFKLIIVSLVAVGILTMIFSQSELKITKSILAKNLGVHLLNRTFPQNATIQFNQDDSIQAQVDYSIDFELQEKTAKILDSYDPDYAAIVALNANTGRIITILDYVKEDDEDLDNLALRATFPAASIFKIVTATAAIDQRLVSSDTVIPFNGRTNTLYKSNVNKVKFNRWTRYMPLSEAFARSVNTIFGKLGVFYLGKDRLLQYASRFGFNSHFNSDLPVQMAHANIEDDTNWSVAEAASGFTLDNSMSPLHGALIASSIVNDGAIMEPYFVQAIKNDKNEIIYETIPRIANIAMSTLTAQEVRSMMQETVRSGTARKSFRQFLRNKKYKSIEVGGKTGTLTGLNPRGKCDWFVGYASVGGDNIAIAALTVHKKYWTVKSAYLVRKYIENYFDMHYPDGLDSNKILVKR